MFGSGDATITESGREEAGSRPPRPQVVNAGSGRDSLGRGRYRVANPRPGRPRAANLVGDPDPAIRERLHRVLSSAGCRVEEVTDRRAAFAAIHDPPDLVIADAGLVMRNGYALLRQLRASSATNWLPVMLLAAEPDDGDRREALEAGADDYLAKPFGARELLSRVGLHLAMARVGREASEAVRASEQAAGRGAGSDRRGGVRDRPRPAHPVRQSHGAGNVGQGGRTRFSAGTLVEALPEIETRRAVSRLSAGAATGRPEHIEARAPAIGNRWVALDAYPAPDGGLVVAYRDIDDRKRAEAQLRQSEERLRLMVEALPDFAFVIRPDGIAEHYNKQMRDYVGGPLGTDPGGPLVAAPAGGPRAGRSGARRGLRDRNGIHRRGPHAAA